ncbi:hypothetical protein [Amycolatopsis sp. Hca4]|uniref:hypothetical protein n=1 Tax=Amycolatopsis sp. Hca4 TaxID=2742131 RepID=UPI001591470D|nr:hypothetical protein [Amycolatopsis sp. Hca4]QKV73787.1 hypothetical protein HUT10_08395 [Amycolatopsis sp. Hca4]
MTNNEISGTVHGHVLQAGVVHGGVHIGGPGPEVTVEKLRRTGALLDRPIDDCDPVRDLRVHRPVQAADLPLFPPYVARTVDADLDRAVAGGGFVVVEGNSAAGKTRTAWEAGRTDVLLLATLRSETRRMIGGDDRYHQMARSAQYLLATARTIRLARDLDQDERRAARRRQADSRIAAALADRTGAGLAEHLAAAPEVLVHRRAGRDGEHEVGAALVSAAVDCHRVGYSSPVARGVLALFPVYLEPRLRHRLRRPNLDEAFEWATTPVHGASSCLQPEADDRFSAFDYLVDQTQAAPRSRTRRGGCCSTATKRIPGRFRSR